MVDSLANRLQRSVAIDDRQIRLIVASKHFGDEDPVRIKSVLGRGVEKTASATTCSRWASTGRPSRSTSRRSRHLS
ncbi:hypothetical protein Ssi02_53990 [Sinosporangium siamense]|uniref:Uncharacterized protein n=1 Tax=Sinosporangium siamense TaxID=1367973 RepID=A0A919RKA2_9ACTN|nr:hypothetical protein Ssi02_53990 [Sinosporangium siamense]